MANVFESITRVVTESDYVVRVWHDEASEAAYDARHNAITELIRANAVSRDAIASAIRTLDGWAAYEIIDAYGNGRVVYRDWP